MGINVLQFVQILFAICTNIFYIEVRGLHSGHSASNTSDEILTNILCNKNKCLAILTNIFCNLYKYILKLMCAASTEVIQRVTPQLTQVDEHCENIANIHITDLTIMTTMMLMSDITITIITITIISITVFIIIIVVINSAGSALAIVKSLLKINIRCFKIRLHMYINACWIFPS